MIKSFTKTLNYLIIGLFLFSGIVALSCKSTPESAEKTALTSNLAGKIAVIETDYGNIKIKFAPEIAPKHVEHFIKLTSEGFYDGLAFHRADPGLLIQGGDPNTRNGDPSMWGMGMPGQETVPAEFSAKPYVRGTVGMARTNNVNSATSQFFICLRDNPSWNGQYTVFGDVIEGIDVVDRISRLPTSDPQFGKLLEKVVMKKVVIEN
jgi:peptidyl-prolyl cis-trans isomerase B (cyclophilin B)